MDWIGAGLNIIGLFLLADYRRHAMYVYLLSSISFIVWGTLNETWSIVTLQCVLFILNMRVIIKWRQNGTERSNEH